jgi:hypothetical protein
MTFISHICEDFLYVPLGDNMLPNVNVIPNINEQGEKGINLEA